VNFSSQPTKNNDEINKLLAAHGATFPAKLEAGKGYILMVETVGDAIRAIIDGKPASFFKFAGSIHATKSKI
jgi:hypothetical protein